MSDASPVVSFGEFNLDSDASELRCDGELVAVQPKVLRLLEYLLRERHRVVPQNELMSALWPSETVVPEVLTTAVRSLRRTLGDAKESPRYVRTIQRRGYRFVAEVTERKDARPRPPSDWPVTAVRHAAFVGRERELERFDTEVCDPESPVALLFVHAAAGIGKTSLLHEFAFRARERGLWVGRLAADYIEPFPESFLQALARVTGLPDIGTLTSDLEAGPLRIFLIDNYDRIPVLDEWLREVLLPTLPPNARLVLASRSAPAVRWRSDPAWQRAVREISLGPFDRNESGRFLEGCQVARSEVEAFWSFTRGHPLALALAAESSSRSGAPFQLGDRTDVVEALVERFAGSLSSDDERDALEAASLMRAVDLRQLGAMIGADRAPRALDWLRTISFVRQERSAVSVHTLARDAIAAQLRERDPARLHEFAERGMNALLVELEEEANLDSSPERFERLFHMGRHHPALRPFYFEEQAAGLALRRAGGRALEPLARMVERHEGKAGGLIAERWLAAQPENVWIVIDASEDALGFAQILLLSNHQREAASWDPTVASVFRHVDANGGLGDDEVITVHRYVIDREHYQAATAVTQRAHEAINCALIWYLGGRARLAHHYVFYADPELYAPMLRFPALQRIPQHDCRSGDREQGMCHREFRGCSARQFVAGMVRRICEAQLPAPQPAPQGAR